MKAMLCTLIAGVIAVIALPSRADDETDLRVVGESLGEMTIAEAMFSTALDGECGKFAPEDFRITRETMRLNIADLKGALSPAMRQKVVEQLGKDGFRTQVDGFKRKAVDEKLAMIRSKNGSQEFACGYVFGSLAVPLVRFENAMARGMKQLGK